MLFGFRLITFSRHLQCFNSSKCVFSYNDILIYFNILKTLFKSLIPNGVRAVQQTIVEMEVVQLDGGSKRSGPYFGVEQKK